MLQWCAWREPAGEQFSAGEAGHYAVVFAESAAKDIVAKRLANNAASQRFQEYLGEDLAVLAKHYGLDLAAFRDMERYMDENKRKIRDAIVKDKKETA